MTKEITEKRITNITLFYLSRFESSSGKVRTMLHRRLQKARLAGQDIPPEASTWIENTIRHMRDLGYLNDRRYAESQIRHLSRQGKSTRFIAQKLGDAGIDDDTIRTLLSESDTSDLDRARRFVARKKIGHYRPTDIRAAYHTKDLAALARAGFSYDIAMTALKGDT